MLFTQSPIYNTVMEVLVRLSGHGLIMQIVTSN